MEGVSVKPNSVLQNLNFVSAVSIVPIEAAHLNSLGMIKQGKYDIAGVKKFRKEGKDISYVSAQAVRKYVRNYLELIHNNPNYYERILRKTSKKDPIIADPVTYFEDDYLGFSQPMYVNPNDDCFEERLMTAAMNRKSPFLTNGLIGVEGLISINASEGWVHPTEGTPLPYKAEFSSGYFQSAFSLELGRIGSFENYGDIVEMDQTLHGKHKSILKSEEGENKIIYSIENKEYRQRQALEFFFDSMLNLYGGGKSTMFADSLHPAILVVCASDVAIQLPPALFHKSEGGNLQLDMDRLKRFLKIWGSKLTTPLIIGYRTGTLQKTEEKKLLELGDHKIHDVMIKVTTPGQVLKEMGVLP